MSHARTIPLALFLAATCVAQAQDSTTPSTNTSRLGPVHPSTSARATPAGTSPVHPAPPPPAPLVANPARDTRLVLVPVAANTRDASALSTSLKSEAIDLRAPRLFDRVFAVRRSADTDLKGGTLLNFGGGNIAASSTPLDTSGTQWFARIDGGIIALFPRSTYLETKDGTFAEIPAGTIYALGRPPAALLGLEPAQLPFVPTTDSAPLDDSRPTARQADSNAARTLPAMLRPARNGDQNPTPAAIAAPDSAPSVFRDDTYRARRVRALLQMAARVPGERRPDPTPPHASDERMAQ
jgi:hypothetical protein